MRSLDRPTKTPCAVPEPARTRLDFEPVNRAGILKMEIRKHEVLERTGRNRRGRSGETAQARRSLALLVCLASLHSCRTLSLPGRRPPRRQQATRTSVDLGSNQRLVTPRDEEYDLSGRSPAVSSNLFTSPVYRRNWVGRHRLVRQHRRKIFRREGNFRLNYKEHDDDLLNILESPRQPIRRGIFRWRQRKSLTKALFPLEEEIEQDEQIVLQDGITTGIEVEELPELPTVKSKIPIGLGQRLKKRNTVTVSNIQELHEAILDKGFQLRDVELNYTTPRSLLTSASQKTANVVTDSLSDAAHETSMTASSAEQNVHETELEENGEPSAEEWQMIGNVLAEDSPVIAEEEAALDRANELFSHDVLRLLHKRYHSNSAPMARAPGDDAKLALSIEGGGMRGAVSCGMAAAIACLGLSDAFDAIYGSSAGSIIGSYFVSRQLYLDVYTDVIPAGKDLFVSKSKIIGDIFRNMLLVVKGPLGKKLNANLIERFRSPAAAETNATSSSEALPPTRAGGLNISFVIDSIMCPEDGLRPLDLEVFAHNDAVQPLRIVSSAVELETGKLKSLCFGSKEGHFQDSFANPAADHSTPSMDSAYLYPVRESAVADENGYRRGIWACLGASMTVPGAAGSPFRMDLPSSEKDGRTPHLCFDAFCYEPVPFRSAVAEGATHVVALRSRPAGFEPKTKPTLYERAVAPLYFRSNGVNTVAEFFEKGGQQYLYAEDVLICDQGLNSTSAIPIPPAKVLYAAPEANGFPSASEKDRQGWERAHLLPITVPADVPELSVLSQDRDEILAGVRSGFAAAYEALAPVVGLEVGPGSLDGMNVAELIFPDADATTESGLDKQTLAGVKLGNTLKAAAEEHITSVTNNEETKADADLSSVPRRNARFRRLLSLRKAFRFTKRSRGRAEGDTSTSSTPEMDPNPPAQESETLFSFLPGVQPGSVPTVAARLQTYLESHSYLEG
ncbi:hypothetical protein ACHAWF_018018 [Thalassiosira exigua]